MKAINFLYQFFTLVVFLFCVQAVQAQGIDPASATGLGTTGARAYIYTWDLDTITNTANDTLNINDTQTSNWVGFLHLDGKQLSGTQGVAVIIEQSCFVTPDADQWSELTRDTLNGSLEQLIINTGTLGAARYRIILDGYEASQSVEYEPVLFLKKD
jgi:hypothetical protein